MTKYTFSPGDFIPYDVLHVRSENGNYPLKAGSSIRVFARPDGKIGVDQIADDGDCALILDGHGDSLGRSQVVSPCGLGDEVVIRLIASCEDHRHD